MAVELILSCEHAVNHAPRRFARLFAGRQRVLDTHRAYDPGALELGRRMAGAFRVRLIATACTRLLVETNRSLHHPKLFSEFSRPLTREQRNAVLTTYYHPHRNRVEQAVQSAINRGNLALHIGVHSFTPVLRGASRRADVGLLYDPRRHAELDFCRTWQRWLRTVEPTWTVRRNHPYRGDADGLTTTLRTLFPADRYLGIELEINQRLPRGPRPRWLAAQRAVISTLDRALASF